MTPVPRPLSVPANLEREAIRARQGHAGQDGHSPPFPRILFEIRPRDRLYPSVVQCAAAAQLRLRSWSLAASPKQPRPANWQSMRAPCIAHQLAVRLGHASALVRATPRFVRIRTEFDALDGQNTCQLNPPCFRKFQPPNTFLSPCVRTDPIFGHFEMFVICARISPLRVKSGRFQGRDLAVRTLRRMVHPHHELRRSFSYEFPHSLRRPVSNRRRQSRTGRSVSPRPSNG